MVDEEDVQSGQMELQIFPRVAAYRAARSGSKNCCADSRVVAVFPSNAVSQRYIFGWKYSPRGIHRAESVR